MSRTRIISVPDGEEIVRFTEWALASSATSEAAIVGCLGLLEELRIHYPVTVVGTGTSAAIWRWGEFSTTARSSSPRLTQLQIDEFPLDESPK